MRFSIVAALLASAAAASAQTIFNVLVGANGTLTYQPNQVVAAVGDTITFSFLSKNHTATQSTFAAPCENMTTPTAGIDSGFFFVPPNATSIAQWSFTLTNASAPLWFYCRQATHCESGMVFAVNPSNTTTKTFANFQAAAMASAPDGTPGAANATSTNGTTASGSAAAGGASATAGAGAGASAGAGGSATTGASGAAATPTNGAMRMGGSAAGVLTVVGLIAGLVL